jgi:hypothetical protein
LLKVSCCEAEGTELLHVRSASPVTIPRNLPPNMTTAWPIAKPENRASASRLAAISILEYGYTP